MTRFFETNKTYEARMKKRRNMIRSNDILMGLIGQLIETNKKRKNITKKAGYRQTPNTNRLHSEAFKLHRQIINRARIVFKNNNNTMPKKFPNQVFGKVWNAYQNITRHG